MGFEVEFVTNTDKPSNYQFEQIASGEIDVSFELWPTGKENLHKQYASFNTTGGKSVHAFKNPHLFGKTGIFEFCHRDNSKEGKCKAGFPGTPRNLANVLATSSGVGHFNASASLAVPSSVSKMLCSVPSQTYGCDADGIYRTKACKANPDSCAPLFHATPQMDTGVIEDLAERLGLAVAVAISYVGIDRLHKIAWDSYTEGVGGLFYAYEPASYVYGLPTNAFPSATIRSDADTDSVPLERLVRNGGSEDLHAFVAKFELTTEDYKELAAGQNMMKNVDDTACDWVKNHEDEWEKWIDFPSRSSISFSICTDGFCLVGCWSVFFVQIVLAVIAFFVASWIDINEEEGRKKFAKQRTFSTAETVQRAVVRHQQVETVNDGLVDGVKDGLIDAYETAPKLARNLSTVVPSMMTQIYKERIGFDIPTTQIYKERIDFGKAATDEPHFLCHVRSFENFTRSNLDTNLMLPPSAASHRWMGGFDRQAIYRYVFSTDAFVPVMFQTAGIGLISSALGSLFYLLLYHEVYKYDDTAFRAGHTLTGEDSIAYVIATTAAATRDITNSFKFFPSFLLIGYVGYTVSRWRDFQNANLCIQGALHNVSAMVGSSFKRPDDPDTQQFLFRIYRYLNLLHLLVYKSKSPWLADLTSEHIIQLGLLTGEEIKILEPMQNKMRDTVVGWVASELQTALEKGMIVDVRADRLVCNLRGQLAGYHDLFEINHPNTWASLMQAVVDMLVLLFAAGTPLTAFVYELGCFQPYCLLFTIFLSLPYLCCTRLLRQLSNPYLGSHDVFNVDSFMADTERCLFAQLRAKIDFSKVASVARDANANTYRPHPQ
jgi:hypothetical protein